MGSARNDACVIDSIAQTWGVLSGAADPTHAHQAMKAVDEHLVQHEERLILLFTPPFDHGSLDPGYVKGYLPGIRENGGQYTHAATWVMQAAALLGQGCLAFELFQIICPILHAEKPADVEVTGLSLMSWPETCTATRPTWVAEAGHGTPGPQAGSIRPFSSRSRFSAPWNRLFFQPCIPPEWSQFEITYRFRSATYTITVENSSGAESGITTVWLDRRAKLAIAFHWPTTARCMMSALSSGRHDRSNQLRSSKPDVFPLSCQNFRDAVQRSKMCDKSSTKMNSAMGFGRCLATPHSRKKAIGVQGREGKKTGYLAAVQQSSHLEVAHGKGSFLEQPGQFALDNSRG